MTPNEAINQLDWYFYEDDGIASEKITKDAYESLKSAFMKLKKIQERVYCPMRTGENYCCMPMDKPCTDIEDNVCTGLRKAYNSSCFSITTATTKEIGHDQTKCTNATTL